MNRSQNLPQLLRWALRVGNEYNARVIATHIIAGSELCAADLRG